ncbi:MAG: tetratricopeptide repeat protein [Planctomycetes bacterium]|nr:tetratricopeptide repeat protein [Planctomycetota bacterium]
MTGSRKGNVFLIAMWIVVGSIYVWAAWQQKQRINLSAAAGGQMPYLVYAQGVSHDGLAKHFGDRNRMPLIPSLLSFVYDEDFDTFVNRSSLFAIAGSAMILMGIGFLAYRHLPPWLATVLTLTATFCVFLPKASFLQAELAYYGLLLTAWLLMCRLLRRRSVWLAITAGVTLGVAFLAKASALGALIAFVATAVLQAACQFFRPARQDASGTDRPSQSTGWKTLRDTGLLVIGFLLVAGPYLAANKSRFDRYFYNVNSTFFLWCDSWAQARAFAVANPIAEKYPQVPPDQIPGPGNYWRSHTASHMLKRLTYGVTTLAALAMHGSYAKYLALVSGFCLVLAVRRRRTRENILSGYGFVVLFCLLFFGGYALSYAWYAQVAYGDRFVLSLLLPALFGGLWLADRLAADLQPFPLFGRRFPVMKVLATTLSVLLMAEGVALASGLLYRPSRAFVQFYYNESRELQKAGNIAEAAKGYRGVVTLDPAFAPAYHDLGMMELVSGRVAAAIAHLAEAVRLAPEKADLRNSYASALLQDGRYEEARGAFGEAVRLDPQLAVAWYNLGGTCHQLSMKKEAAGALSRLRALDARLAEQLARLIER